MNHAHSRSGLQLRSLARPEGQLEISLARIDSPAP